MLSKRTTLETDSKMVGKQLIENIKPLMFGIVLLGICLLNGGLVIAQSTKDTADNNLKSSARVNPVTLAMEFSLPLGIYPGRNGNSMPIAINYSSKVWTMEKANYHFDSYFVNNNDFDYEVYRSNDVQPFFADKTIAGWTSSLQPVVITQEAQLYNDTGDLYNTNIIPPSSSTNIWGDDYICEQFDQSYSWINGCYTVIIQWHCRNPSGENIEVTTNYSISCGGGGGPTPTPVPDPTPSPQTPYLVKRVRIQMVDGVSHEFRKDDKFYNCANNPTDCEPDTSGTYLAVDGSGMRLERRETQPNNEIRDVLYLPGGGRYIFPAQPIQQSQFNPTAEKYIDKDGNVSSYKLNERKWTDSLGREIVDVLPNGVAAERPSIGTQTYNLNGLGGTTTMPYTLKWQKLSDTFELPNTTTKFTGQDECRFSLPSPVSGNYLFGNQPDDSSDTFIDYANRVKYIDKTRSCASIQATAYLFDPTVLAEIVYPNNQKYQFKYNEFGEITKIIYPTGGYERFEYGHIQAMGVTAPEVYTQANRGVNSRFVSFDGTTETQTWTYSQSFANGYAVATIAPDGSKSERFLYSSTQSTFGFEDPRNGMVKEERIYDANGVLRSRSLNDWEVTGAQGTGAYSIAKRDARVKQSVSITIEGGQALAMMSETEYETPGENNSTAPTDLSYFARLNAKQTKSYHYLSLAVADAQTRDINWLKTQFYNSGQVSGISQTDYQYSANYKARGIASLPTETRVLNPANPGEVLAKTQTLFDESTYMVSDSGALSGNAVSTWVDPATDATIPAGSRALRLCPTTSKVWNKDTNSWIETHAQFDQYGNVRKAWDASNDSTRFVETEYSAVYNYAYPTKVITPAPDPTNTTGTNTTSTVETTYDLTTGLALTVKDEFGQITQTEYNDPLLRPTRTFAVNFSAPETNIEYGDTVGNLYVKVRKQIDGTNWDEATTFADGLGRTFKTQAKDSQGDVFTETQYDTMGRVKQATNPYRNGETKLWSKPRYDEQGRVVESFAPAPDGQTGASLGITSYSISTTPIVGTAVTATDASGRKSRSITNALGQLVRVDEATGIGGTETADLGTLASPNQPTSYTYNAQGKMVKVQQGGQYRYFKYDSLGRLIRVRQPEQEVNAALNLADSYNTSGQWTAAFSYDVFGNVLTATDAKGVTITNSYDKASRVKTRSYSDGTPTVSFYYDGKGLTSQQSPNYAKGKLTKVTSSVSETRNTLFDNLGRLLQAQQITDGQTYTSSYQYNLSGALIQETYPSGRVVKNEFNTNGDLQRIFGKANATATERTYANSFTYTADGKIKSLKLGNNLWESAKFNSRLQVTELNLGHSATDGGLWKLGYEYGELNTDGTTVNTAKNTGNIAKQTVSFNGLAQPFIQTYKYDSLYRLTEAKETSNSNQTWKQTFGYDRFGNRTGFSQIIGSVQLVLDNKTFPQIDATTNRFNSGQGYSYDFSGNVITDADGRQFTFNGDNKQTQVKDVNNNVVGTYFYDGDGKRVKKVTNTETTIFVYSGGKLVAEYSTQPPPTNPTTNYTATDQLGSPRVITNAVGQVTSRRDFMPFGEELFPDAVYRKASDKYGATDSVRQRFTGYQKDTETGLDFAEARYYNNAHGRFTAVDPLLASGKSADPQTFNRYVYVLNNPLVLTDPTGLQVGKKKQSESKGIVDVFIIRIPNGALGDENEGITRTPNEFKQIQRQAGKNGYSINLKFFGGDKGGLANDELKTSLQAQNRIVIIVGHSFGLDQLDSGIMTGNTPPNGNNPEVTQQLGVNGLTTVKNGAKVSENLPDIKARAVFVFTCYPGGQFAKTINPVLSDNSVFYFNNPNTGNGKVNTQSNLSASSELLRSITIQNQDIPSAVNDANELLKNDSNKSNAHLENTRGNDSTLIDLETPIKVVEVPIKLKPEE